MAGTFDAADRRANRFRWAAAIVPLLGVCCVVISGLVLLGLVEIGYTLIYHQRLLPQLLGHLFGTR